MKPKTVNELLGELQKLNTRGLGEHIVLVSDDDECNGYHAIWDWGIYEGHSYRYLNEQTNKMEDGKTVLIG